MSKRGKGSLEGRKPSGLVGLKEERGWLDANEGSPTYLFGETYEAAPVIGRDWNLKCSCQPEGFAAACDRPAPREELCLITRP